MNLIDAAQIIERLRKASGDPSNASYRHECVLS